eukprot:7318288-Pyramimonas_sp.AAC.1
MSSSSSLTEGILITPRLPEATEPKAQEGNGSVEGLPDADELRVLAVRLDVVPVRLQERLHADQALAPSLGNSGSSDVASTLGLDIDAVQGVQRLSEARLLQLVPLVPAQPRQEMVRRIFDTIRLVGQP